MTLEGFKDDGKSFEDAFIIAKRDGYVDWMSRPTRDLIISMEFYLMKNHDVAGFASVVWDHIVERIRFFFIGFSIKRAWRFWSMLFEFIIVYFFSEDGKFSLNNKVFTGFAFIGWNSLILIVQYVWNAWINQWWAKGNLLIIFDQIFGWIQYTLSIFLVGDFEFYLYILRPIRFISFILALCYTTIWWFMFITALWLMYYQDEFTEQDNQALPDMMFLSLVVYSVLNFSFTSGINEVIVLKELTMN